MCLGARDRWPAKTLTKRAWLERIDYSGSLAPTLETLNGLIFAHAHAISYETLDIMLGRPPGSMSAPSKPR
jgi:arylamine N-acetyltransferase